jgi:hypothetical protein
MKLKALFIISSFLFLLSLFLWHFFYWETLFFIEGQDQGLIYIESPATVEAYYAAGTWQLHFILFVIFSGIISIILLRSLKKNKK